MLSKQIKSPPILLIDRDLIVVSVLKIALIFLLVEEEVVFAGVVRPDVFDAFVDVALVLNLVQVLYDFKWSAGTDRVIYQFVFLWQATAHLPIWMRVLMSNT